MHLDPTGWLSTNSTTSSIHHAPSPNYNARPEQCDPYLLVVHSISLPPYRFSGPAVVQFFQNTLDFDTHPWFTHIRDVRVSAHFFIRRSGHIVQFVSTWDRAWHAGISSFDGREQCNDFSIGIELEGADAVPYTPIQYQRLAALSRCLAHFHPIRAIRGHEHIAPGRKSDPGPAFNWHAYRLHSQLPTTFFP